METWIYAENLKAFVRLLTYLAGYTLYDENYEWLAIENGLKVTDANDGRWYTFPIEGKWRLTLDLALDPDSSYETYIRVTSENDLDPELRAQLDLLISICQDYSVQWRH